MNRDEARQYCLDNATQILERDRSGHGWICPLCGGGSRTHGTGITENPDSPGHYTCWAGCFENSDIFDIVGLKYGATSVKDKFDLTYKEFGLSIDTDRHTPTGHATQSHIHNSTYTTTDTQSNIHNTSYTIGDTQLKEDKKPAQKAVKDYTADYERYHLHIRESNYLLRRGISQAVTDRFNIGYDPAFPFSNGRGVHPAIIIPTSKESFVVRNTDPNAEKADRYDSRGAKHPLNIEALKTATGPIFITEGEIDALSIVEAGGEAIALGGVQHKRLIEALQKNKPTQPIIIATDNDEPGIANAVSLMQQISDLGISCYRLDLFDGYKDANEALASDREGFLKTIAGLKSEGDLYRISNSAESHMQGFLNRIAEKKTVIPTGFSSLDSHLDGGLYSGLYIVGAISSLGKTTFCLQLIDQVAQAGYDVLMFSLEMARDELMAKSISRHTYQVAMNSFAGNTKLAKTTRGILSGARYSHYSPEERSVIQMAAETYQRYASNVFIHEGIGNIGVAQIGEVIANHIKFTKKKPVVLIDYIQILAPARENGTDKQNTDKAVLELKRLSREYDIPVIGISSFNRDSYTEPVSMSSFKESGAIEYGSDVLLALQYAGMDYTDGETDTKHRSRVSQLRKDVDLKAKNGEPIDIQVKILKNRNGSRDNFPMLFRPLFNCFSDPSGADMRRMISNSMEHKKADSWVDDLPVDDLFPEEENPKPMSKRDKARADLIAAFNAASDGSSTTTLKAMAMEMDSTTATVKKRILEYAEDLYSINKNEVTDLNAEA